MASYRYTETHERYYPRLGLTARPGDVHDFDGDPPNDDRWEPEPVSKKKQPDTTRSEE